MSQHAWFKGPRCGVDNCRTRLWRSIDGRQVCRYGHVKEGDLEIGEDEDDFFSSQGRRLVIPSQDLSQRAATDDGTPKVLFGSEGTALFMQCFQYLLRRQLAWLIGDAGMPKELEAVVRALWAMYIDETKFAKTEYDNVTEQVPEPSAAGSQSQGNNGITADDESDNEESSSETSKFMILGADELNEDMDGLDMATEGEGKTKQQKVEVELMTSVALCYLGCVLLRVPVFVSDFNRWIYRCELPYMQALRLLPLDMRKRLAQYYGHVFSPKGPPPPDKLHAAVQRTASVFDRRGIAFPQPRWELLTVKFVHDLLLPPEVGLAAQKILIVLGTKPTLAVRTQLQRRGWPEPLVAAAVVIAAKLFCGFDINEDQQRGETDTSAANNNWDVWADMLRKLWIEDESPAEADERDVSWWDPARIDRYLAWFQNSFVTEESGQDASRKRLLNMFPLPELKQTEQLNAVPSTVDEVLRLLQLTLSASGSESSAAGSHYPRFRRLESPPRFVSILYQTAAKLAGTREDTLCQRVFALENKMWGSRVVKRIMTPA